MKRAVSPGSSTLLLMRLSVCPTDEAAWGDFIQRYSGAIYGWCRRYGLQDTDARDVTQEVFSGLLRALRDFDRARGRFRTWLFKIVAHEVHDWCYRPAHRLETGTIDARRSLASEPARHELEARLNEEFDLELLAVAERTVQLKVSPRMWQCYQLRCREGFSLQDAADRVNLPMGHVSKYALRTRDMVSRQIALLEERNDRVLSGVTHGRRDKLPPTGKVAAIPS